MEIIGYLGAILIGISLGLIGGGGSILTVPLLVYLFNIPPLEATAYSLFIVGTTSGVGAVKNMVNQQVDYKTALLFAPPSFLAVYLTRRYLVPAIPEEIFELSGFLLTKPLFIMVLFALIMFGAGISMLRNKSTNSNQEKGKNRFLLVILEGIIVGVLTGLVGAGGGFLIIPALVLLAGLDMKMAVGTSLVIIALKSLFGFTGDLQSGLLIDWPFLLLISGLAIVGIFAGTKLSQYISGQKLKKGFGWFVLIMATYILTVELL